MCLEHLVPVQLNQQALLLDMVVRVILIFWVEVAVVTMVEVPEKTVRVVVAVPVM
jgi:hypothetical protein